MNILGAKSTGRNGFLDEVRGLSVLLMVLYHGLYDLAFLFYLPFNFYSPFLNGLQLYICSSFILVSGICCRYSKNNIKRGLQVLLVGMAISAVTFFAMPEQVIYFGILHLLGCSMILYGLLQTVLDKLPAFWGLLLMLLLFGVTRTIGQGYIGMFGIFSVQMPQLLYDVGVLFPLGFPAKTFFSSDYFPIMPWGFLFFAGSYVGVFFEKGYMPSFFYQTHSSFLAAVGRRALLVYTLHQPVLYGVLSVVFTALAAAGIYIP